MKNTSDKIVVKHFIGQGLLLKHLLEESKRLFLSVSQPKGLVT